MNIDPNKDTHKTPKTEQSPTKVTFISHSASKWSVETGLLKHLVRAVDDDNRGEHRFEKSTGWLKIQGAITVIQKKFHTEDSQILVATGKKFSRPGDLMYAIYAPPDKDDDNISFHKVSSLRTC